MNEGIEKGQVMGIWRNVYRRLVDPSHPERQLREYSKGMRKRVSQMPYANQVRDWRICAGFAQILIARA